MEQILREVALGLLEARLVVDRERWRRVSANDGFAMEFLTSALGAPTDHWDAQRLLGAPALDTFRRVNRRAHTWATSEGAARFRPSVIRAQGGEFCSMCGRRESLSVDHIVPVSAGGSSDSVPNMQLLCQDCNLGKSNLRDHLLPTAIGLNVTRSVGVRLRFKHLLLESVEVDGRTRGVCRCGLEADSAELRVVVATDQAAANLLTLTTRCTGCPQER